MNKTHGHKMATDLCCFYQREQKLHSCLWWEHSCTVKTSGCLLPWPLRQTCQMRRAPLKKTVRFFWICTLVYSHLFISHSETYMWTTLWVFRWIEIDLRAPSSWKQRVWLAESAGPGRITGHHRGAEQPMEGQRWSSWSHCHQGREEKHPDM